MSAERNEINEKITGGAFYKGHLRAEDRFFFREEEPELKFNVIGAGVMAMEHIRVTALEGRARIHGVYDRDERARAHIGELWKKTWPDQELLIYDSLDAALNDPEADAILICTPNYSHIEIVEKAIKTGKHILLEKPMVTKAEDAARILKLVKGYPAVFQVGLQYRYKAIYREAARVVQKERSLGRVHGISIVEHRIPFLDKVDQWNKFSEYSGGTLVEKCCHYFDLFRFFAGARPKSVYAVGDQAVNFKGFTYKEKESDILDQAFVIVEYENGIKCSFQLCMFAPLFYEELTITGEKGRIRAYEERDFLGAGEEKTFFQLLNADHGVSTVSAPGYPAAIQSSGHMGGTYFEHKAFVDQIRGIATEAAAMEDGFWSVLTGIAAERSVKSGTKIMITDILAEIDGEELIQ